MANPRIPYLFSNDGPALAPAQGKSILVHLVVNVEHWQFEASMPRTIITPPHGKETIPDVPNFSWADYGMRAGLPRIIAVARESNMASRAVLTDIGMTECGEFRHQGHRMLVFESLRQARRDA